jgi:hypothetical protein
VRPHRRQRHERCDGGDEAAEQGGKMRRK